jgi:DNA mismatch endonuclease, patch repair protein
MSDTVSKAERSRIMALIKAKDTTPEITVRKIVSAMGHRYRLHPSKLPGKPDLAFPGQRKAIFVHGCFWHQHDCGRCRLPQTRRAYWKAKIQRNVLRDQNALKTLRNMGWKTIVLWECQLTMKRRHRLLKRLDAFLNTPPA